MRVMVIIKATKNSEAGALPSKELFAEMEKYNEQLAKAGILLAADGLKPSSRGKRVRFAGGKRTVLDGPFTDTRDLVAGYWLWQVETIDEAIDWVKRCPDPMPGEEALIEIRPLFELDDFAAIDPTGELRRKEKELLASVGARH
ncbi:MAG: YciI family protein [Nitrospinae bacterium]|nr:YciI family protein [Nitrospinota bacterium]